MPTAEWSSIPQTNLSNGRKGFRALLHAVSYVLELEPFMLHVASCILELLPSAYCLLQTQHEKSDK